MSKAASATRARAPRSYASPLRERQMKETKEVIFRAATEQLADHGLADFHIPRLAEVAGVSVRTVYRYFPTKDALLESFAEWLDEKVGTTLKAPIGLDDLLDGVETVYASFEDNEDILRSHWATPHGRAIREKGRVRRLSALGSVVRDAFPHLSPLEQRHVTAMLSLLHSSRTWQAFKDDFGMDGRESGKVVAWALRTLVADLRHRDAEAAQQQKTNTGKK